MTHPPIAANGFAVPVGTETLDEPRRRIPLFVKVPYTIFMAVLVPYYWATYGPTNFLYFCDVAILVTLVALWTESRLLASVQAVAVLLPQTLWVADFVLKGVVGSSLLGLADYMYSPSIPLFVRGLSSFHGWLPFLLVWLVWRLGYDRQALLVQTVCAWALLVVCFLFTPAPPAPAADPNLPVNINYVFGIGDKAAQTWMPPAAWLALVMLVLPLCIYLPTHLVLRRLFAEAPGHSGSAAASGRPGIAS
jgi:hypothetical protein